MVHRMAVDVSLCTYKRSMQNCEKSLQNTPVQPRHTKILIFWSLLPIISDTPPLATDLLITSANHISIWGPRHQDVAMCWQERVVIPQPTMQKTIKNFAQSIENVIHASESVPSVRLTIGALVAELFTKSWWIIRCDRRSGNICWPRTHWATIQNSTTSNTKPIKYSPPPDRYCILGSGITHFYPFVDWSVHCGVVEPNMFFFAICPSTALAATSSDIK